MIVLDIETSGLSPWEGIWQIGAIDLKNPENVFIQESKIDDDDKIDPKALVVIGKTENELRDSSKQSQKQLIENYLDWVSKIDERVFLGHNVGWDITMIQSKCIKYGIFEKFAKTHKQKGIDLYTTAQNKHFELKGEFSKKGELGAFSLSEVLNFCGIIEERINIEDFSGKIVKEGKHHDAIDDCKLEAECYYRLTKGKGLFREFEKFPVPDYLKNDNL